MSEKSTPRRSSEAKAVISAHTDDLLRSLMHILSARIPARQHAGVPSNTAWCRNEMRPLLDC